jgi:hypothetical protein
MPPARPRDPQPTPDAAFDPERRRVIQRLGALAAGALVAASGATAASQAQMQHGHQHGAGHAASGGAATGGAATGMTPAMGMATALARRRPRPAPPRAARRARDPLGRRPLRLLRHDAGDASGAPQGAGFRERTYAQWAFDGEARHFESIGCALGWAYAHGVLDGEGAALYVAAYDQAEPPARRGAARGREADFLWAERLPASMMARSAPSRGTPTPPRSWPRAARRSAAAASSTSRCWPTSLRCRSPTSSRCCSGSSAEAAVADDVLTRQPRCLGSAGRWLTAGWVSSCWAAERPGANRRIRRASAGGGLGDDRCPACGMAVVDGRFAAQARTEGGRTLVYDAIECLADHLNGHAGEVPVVVAAWLADRVASTREVAVWCPPRRPRCCTTRACARRWAAAWRPSPTSSQAARLRRGAAPRRADVLPGTRSSNWARRGPGCRAVTRPAAALLRGAAPARAGPRPLVLGRSRRCCRSRRSVARVGARGRRDVGVRRGRAAAAAAVLALTAPRLARRATWAFWGSLALRPAGAFRGAVIGATLGLLLPLCAGAAAAAVVGAAPAAAPRWWCSVAAIVIAYGALGGLVAAATLEPAKAVALGAVVWGVGVVAYEPALVALAVAFAERAFEPWLVALVLAHPLEVARVALLRTLEVPVFVGPTGLLLERWWGGRPWPWAAAWRCWVPAACCWSPVPGWRGGRAEASRMPSTGRRARARPASAARAGRMPPCDPGRVPTTPCTLLARREPVAGAVVAPGRRAPGDPLP